MSAAEFALLAFALCNSVRVFAYVPQIIAVARDRNGATAISYVTWGLFAISHLSTVAYAVLVMDDWRMATVFAANAACCVVIVTITAIQRRRNEEAQTASQERKSPWRLMPVGEAQPDQNAGRNPARDARPRASSTFTTIP